MKPKSQLLAILALLLISFAVSCEKENLALAEIHGEVEFDDALYKGAIVNLYSGTFAANPFIGYSKHAITDDSGKFDFDDLSKGEYYLFAFLIDGHDTLSRDKIIIITTDKGTYEADIHIESDDHVD